MRRIVLTEGVRSGLVLSGIVLLLGVLGTAPAFTTLPEAPLLILAAAAPVVALGLAGFRSRRKAGRLVAGALGGTLAGAISGTAAGLSYLVLDQVFFTTVSKQPDKMLNFQSSGLPTMRDYLLANDLRNVAMGLVLGTLGGALLGALGALLGKVLSYRPAQKSNGSLSLLGK